ncbi:phosphoribosyl-AMP cyclohydrolase [Halomonas sp. TRM85114]|uniref:phosphoribosyl-AMP cyclohydrolase n=1 Tax=Halomonas jincaotanensis TaxID=2810616 RepID=UPI001BD55200|nr:phosphoribosyl-AMP cyclohydrolase [Halomonas jincaotanensis]MBS9402568.1 phosphoribosyl-AMP cyclohydrolase [Halomonas jincaotanensis]
MTDTFKTLERADLDSLHPLDAVLDAVRFNVDGLVPAIAQQYDTGEVLMMAWMNRGALDESLSTGRVCYWSRSHQAYWRKGESSGQQQALISAALDCDGDTLLLQVDQTGPACHTGRKSCFYVSLESRHARIVSAPLIDPATLYGPERFRG